MQNHSRFTSIKDFTQFYHKVIKQKIDIPPYELDYKRKISVSDEFKANNYNPNSDNDKESFYYFASKYIYDIFSKEDIEELVNIEVFNRITYTCEYLSSLLVEDSQSKTTQESLSTTNNQNTINHFLFPNAQATHYGLIYKKNKYLYGLNNFENLSYFLLNNYGKILLEYPRRTDTAYLVKNFLDIEKNPFSTLNSDVKDGTVLSPAELFLLEKMTNLNSIAVLTHKLLPLTKSNCFDTIYYKALTKEESKFNLKYLLPVHKIIDELAVSNLSHSKAIILDMILDYKVDKVMFKRYFTKSEIEEYEKKVSEIAIEENSSTKGYKLYPFIEEDENGHKRIQVRNALKFNADFSMEYTIREYKPEEHQSKLLLDLSRNEEYRLYFVHAVLQKTLQFIEKIVDYKTSHLFCEYLKNCISNKEPATKFLLTNIISSNNTFICNIIKKSKLLKGFDTSDIIIIKSIAESYKNKIKTTEAMDAINEYVYNYLIYEHRINKYSDLLPSYKKHLVKYEKKILKNFKFIKENRIHIKLDKDISKIISESRI